VKCKTSQYWKTCSSDLQCCRSIIFYNRFFLRDSIDARFCKCGYEKVDSIYKIFLRDSFYVRFCRGGYEKVDSIYKIFLRDSFDARVRRCGYYRVDSISVSNVFTTNRSQLNFNIYLYRMLILL